jgi:hypothetical protein
MNQGDDAAAPTPAGKTCPKSTGFARGFDDDIKLVARVFKGSPGSLMGVVKKLTKGFELTVPEQLHTFFNTPNFGNYMRGTLGRFGVNLVLIGFKLFP